MRKVYFVSYSFVGGFGCVEIFLDKKDITSFDDITNIKKEIERDNPKLKDVVILFYRELKERTSDKRRKTQ